MQWSDNLVLYQTFLTAAQDSCLEEFFQSFSIPLLRTIFIMHKVWKQLTLNLPDP